MKANLSSHGTWYKGLPQALSPSRPRAPEQQLAQRSCAGGLSGGSGHGHGQGHGQTGQLWLPGLADCYATRVSCAPCAQGAVSW